MENTICRDYQLAAMNREMNALYRQVTGQKTSQKKWLGRRMACGNDAICLASVYRNRMVELVSVITGTDFSLYQYAHHVIDDDFFHPRAAILVENYIKDHIGDATYEAFSACSSRHSTHQVTSNYLLGLTVVQECSRLWKVRPISTQDKFGLRSLITRMCRIISLLLPCTVRVPSHCRPPRMF